MLNPVLFHLPLKAGLASPVCVLAAVVGQHLTRYTILSDSPPLGLQNMRCGLASIKTQAGDVTRVVVQKTDQVPKHCVN